MSHLPSDDEIRRQLVDVRSRVLDATREVRSPRRSTRFRTTRNLVVAGVAGLAMTAGALYFAGTSQRIDHQINCFGSADLGAEIIVMIYAPSADSPPLHGPKADPEIPIGMCGLAWSTGAFEPDADPTNVEPIYPVPPLTACTQTNGGVAVFPNRGDVAAERLCGTLGLAVWDPVSGV